MICALVKTFLQLLLMIFEKLILVMILEKLILVMILEIQRV